jgi:predicted naringenin-chalcone synthase
MSAPKIIALHTGVPAQRYRQAEIADFYTELIEPQSDRRKRAIHALFDAAGVEQRHSVVDADFFQQSKSTQERNDHYMREARELGKCVIEQGLTHAGVTPDEITDFVVVSCTGFSIPGLDLLIAHDLGMRAHLNRTCVLGMGCYGAFPGIRLAWDSIKAHRDGLALVLSVELCTLHLQFDNSVETVVSTSLFADGAAMMLISGDNSTSSGPTLIDHEAYCDYQTLDDMSFTVTDEGFYMYLSSYVPDVLKANIESFISRLLARNNLCREDVKFWAIHPGSKKIVQHIQQQLELTDAQVQNSLEVLQNNGNMSSATVLFVLNCIMQSDSPQPGDYGVMMAFGPGLTMESLLIRW